MMRRKKVEDQTVPSCCWDRVVSVVRMMSERGMSGELSSRHRQVRGKGEKGRRTRNGRREDRRRQAKVRR
jgi:hypothetical protein